MDDQLAHAVGDRVRFHRLSGRKTQVVVAGLAGITTDYLYQIERGKKLPALPVLLALASALGVSAATLIGEADAEPAPRRPRELGASLHRTLTTPATSDDVGMPLPDLRKRVDQAWRLWQTSPTRYSQVGAVLPELIIEVGRPCHAGTILSEAQRCIADLYGLVRTVAKRSGRVDLSLLAADRAWWAAEASGDRLRVGAARWNAAHVALAEGHHEVAEETALAAAENLRGGSGPDAAAVYGSLILVAAMAAARRDDVWTARDRLRSITPVAWKTGERNTLWTAFGPTNLAMHAVSIEVEAGEANHACQLADNVTHERSPSIERRVAFLLEQARSYRQRRDHGAVLMLLQRAAREAPEDLAFRPLARDLVRSVIQHGGRTAGHEASLLAARLSVRVS